MTSTAICAAPPLVVLQHSGVRVLTAVYYYAAQPPPSFEVVLSPLTVQVSVEGITTASSNPAGSDAEAEAGQERQRPKEQGWRLNKGY